MNPEKITKNSAKSGHTGYNYRLFLAISTFVVIIIVASKRFIIRCPVVFLNSTLNISLGDFNFSSININCLLGLVTR